MRYGVKDTKVVLKSEPEWNTDYVDEKVAESSLLPSIEIVSRDADTTFLNLRGASDKDTNYFLRGFNKIAFLKVPSTSTLCVSIVGSSFNAL